MLTSSPSDHHLSLLDTHPAAVEPEEPLLTYERPSRPSIHPVECLCEVYHYSVPGQINNVGCSSGLGHESERQAGISREPLVVFTKQKKVNKEGRGKSGREPPRRSRGADKSRCHLENKSSDISFF